MFRDSDPKVTAEEIAGAYGISRAHLTKVVQRLAREGFIETSRGRGGGLRLAREPEAIGLGEVVRATESLELVQCGECVIAPGCGLRPALGEALEAFLAVLDRYTLADAARRRTALRRRLGGGAPPRRPGPSGAKPRRRRGREGVS